MLTYSPAKVRFIVPQGAAAKELQAAALINANLGQNASKKELISRATFNGGGGSPGEHQVFVGKADHLPSGFPTSVGDFDLNGGQWVNRRSGQPISGDQGVLLYFAPSADHTVLIVSGNSDEGVYQAAKFLTTRPKPAELSGVAMGTTSGWGASGGSNQPPRYINKDSMTFRELGFKVEEVHKLYAPPIVYHVPVVSDFRKNGDMFIDLNYAYGPGMNPLFSSLELRINDKAFANIPLTEPNGETLAHASFPIPRDLIDVRNTVVAQFHMMPDKYGFCRDNYVDNAWGKVFDDSAFRITTSPGSRLPDVGVLNDTMFPYSLQDNLESASILLPEKPTEAMLDAMLGFTARLGRATDARGSDLRLGLNLGGGAPGGKNVVAIRQPGQGLGLPGDAILDWKSGGVSGYLRQFANPGDANKVMVSTNENGKGAYVEQFNDGGRTITVITSADPAGFRKIAGLFATDKNFEELSSGLVTQGSTMSRDLRSVEPLNYHTERVVKTAASATPTWYSGWFGWMPSWLRDLPWGWILGGLAGLFLLMLIVPLFTRNRR